MPASRTSRVSGATVVIGTAAALIAIAVSAVAAGGPAAATGAAAGTTPVALLVSADASGVPGNQQSGSTSVTPDGRFLAFESIATNLVPGDDNGQRDIFLRDRRTGTVELISVARTGAPANGESRIGVTAISADGRFVAFESVATDLVAGRDGNGEGRDAYVRDRLTRTTARVSGGSPLTHAEAPSISGDGRFVAYVADDNTLVRGDTNLLPDVFVYDRRSATVRRASVGPRGAQADNVNSAPVLSGNGRYVAFLSFAANLVPGDPDGAPDIFVRDLRLGRTERVSYGVDGGEFTDGMRQGPTISSDGRLVAFAAYEGQVYVRDRARGVTTLVSASSAGVAGDEFSHTPRLSPDGRYVTFVSSAWSLAPPHPSSIPIYRRDLATGTTERLRLDTVGNAPLDAAAHLFAASNAGVVFSSNASNIGSGDGPATGPSAIDQVYLADW